MFCGMRAAVLAAIIPSLSWAVILPRVTEPITPSVQVPTASVVSTSLVDSTCLPYTPGVLLLEAWGTSASSFCTSWEPITTVVVTSTTSTTTTLTAPTSTITASSTRTVTATASPRTVYTTTITATATTFASASSATRQCAAYDKRDVTVTVPVPTVPTASSLMTKPLPSETLPSETVPSETVPSETLPSETLPSETLPVTASSPVTASLPVDAPTSLSAYASSYIVTACECLHLPTPTSTTTTTIIQRTTTTPLTTYTPVSTTTTTSTVTTASTATVPGVILSHPTAITNVDSNGYATASYDDGYYQIVLPFPLQLFGQNSSSVWVGINGWVSVSNDPKSNYVNTQLPASTLPNIVFSAYWSDLYVYSGTKQGLYYQVNGNQGSRTASFEWFTSTYGNSHGYYHFIATFFENSPGAVIFDYYELTAQIPTTDSAYGTVGVQRYSTSQYAQYSFNNAAPVTPSSRVIYSPSSNTFQALSC